MKKYKIIYMDPPWSHKNKVGGSGESGASSHYGTMTIEELRRLDIRSISEDDSFLFMWWVASMPEEAISLVKSYGFKLKTMTCFSWIKQTETGKDHFGMGFYSRQQQEHCLFAKRGNCPVEHDEQEHCLIARKGRPKVMSHSVRQNVRSAVRDHSRKPDEVRDRIVELCGKESSRLEMFARPPFGDGWDKWGDEVENDVVIPVLSIQGLVNKAVKRT